MTDDNIEKADDKIIKLEPSNIEQKPQANIAVKKSGEEFELEVSKLIPSAGQIELTDKQTEILYAPIEDEIVEIRPDGLIYLPWMEYVTRMRKAFGLNWAIIPKGDPKLGPSRNSILWGFYLIIQGKLAGFAIGEQAYSSSNLTMNWSDAVEGAKSNALMRLCKGIGIGLELWKPSFIRSWKEKYAESYNDKGKTKWRKKGRIILEDLNNAQPTFSSVKLPEDVIVAEVVEDGPSADLFPAQDNAGTSVPISQESGLFPEEQAIGSSVKDGLINAIKAELKIADIDEKAFKAWLMIIGPEKRPPRQYVNLKFGHPAFSEGIEEDLKKLHAEIRNAIKTFRKYQKEAT